MTCVFCQIVAAELPAAVVYRDDEHMVFLDSRPVFMGHCLVVPTVHIETLTDVPPPALAPLFDIVQRTAGAVERGCRAQGTFVAMNNRVSQSVPHLHVHVVPRTRGDGLRGFFWPRQKYADDSAQRMVADAIREAYDERASP